MSKYFLIGEIHGTKECPEEFFKFVQKYKIKKVALEFPSEFQKQIDEYSRGEIKLEKIPLFKSKNLSHDGRASESVKRLIKKLKRDKIKIFFIDGEAKNGNQRDKLMARNLSKIKGNVAFLCGNVHARKKSWQLEKFDKMYKQYPKGVIKTCGSFMDKKKIVAINIHAINGGKFYNYRVQNYFKDNDLLKLYNLKDLPKIIKPKDNSFDFVYLINKFSVSK